MKGRKELEGVRESLKIRRQKMLVIAVAVASTIFSAAFIKVAFDHHQVVEVVEINFTYEPDVLDEVGGAQALCDSVRRAVDKTNKMNEEVGINIRYHLESCRPLVEYRDGDPQARLNYEEVLRTTNLLLGTDFGSSAREHSQVASARKGK